MHPKVDKNAKFGNGVQNHPKKGKKGQARKFDYRSSHSPRIPRPTSSSHSYILIARYSNHLLSTLKQL
jgi:hypothetical protein